MTPPADDRDGIETRSNTEFEARFWHFQIGSWIVITLLVGIGLAGGFGRGPLSNAVATTANGRLEYERLLRYKTPSSYRLTLTPAAGGGDQVRVMIDAALLAKLKVSQIVPTPQFTEPRADGVVLVYPAASLREAFSVELSLEPKSIGGLRGSIGVLGGDPAEIHQFVLP
jgi:hypothetical protein